ncbi:Vacuolar protein sorting-associated protein ist1 [Didymosphaeria variabile]|uniref:Vacuolar protein sorting-associated protein ist1 n=1 Tax=Didymosphaeria variabile TaxID=1932322 RepID=A0A9W8XC90_9PLEO|nr:Vacuolar protein sorting-associated protein ist1 [Didymosphaeria variabile]KAJ4347034.1 Vacuolar protein sorting-associated protein ist1 [Didymosphaeria variabile]
MAPAQSLVNKLKVQLKLSISRLRMVQQKDSAKAKQQRREMAQLLEAGKLQSARIRVENIIRSDITTELHEMLELYCELLLARSQLLDPPSSPSSPANTIPLDPALEEAVRSIIYAAPRTEIKELHAVRALLVEKFGKDVALASMEGEGVADRVERKLRVETPKTELVDAYLSEIARFYGVPFGEPEPAQDDDEDDDEPSGGVADENPKELEPALGAIPKASRREDEEEELVKAIPPKKFGPQSPLRVVPPSPSTDNVAPKLKLPGAAAAKLNASKVEGRKPAAKKEDSLGKIPDVDELAKRFAALKR